MNRAIRVLAICIAMVVALNFGMVECKALEEGAAVGVNSGETGEEGPIYDVPEGRYVEELSAEEYAELVELQEEWEPSAEELSEYSVVTDNGDGTETVTIYMAPVRYQEESGEWRKIEPELKEYRGGEEYRSEGTAVETRISGKTGKAPYAVIREGEYSVELRLREEDETAAGAVEAMTEAGGCGEKQAERKVGVGYKGLYGGCVEMRVRPTGHGIKEELILTEEPEEEVFAYELRLEGMYPVKCSDMNILLLDKRTNQVKGAIPAPYMSDAANEEGSNFSYDIEVRIYKASEGEYVYELIPDREWLREEGREYPVVVDPSVTFSNTLLADTNVASKWPGNNYHAEDTMKVGLSTNDGRFRAYMRFANFMEHIGANRHITKAELKAYEEYQGSSAPNINLYEVTGKLDISTLNWNTQPSISGTEAASIQVTTPGWYSWDVTGTVRKWYQEGAEQTALCMKSGNENANQYKRFCSTESREASLRPRLEVTYAAAPSMQGEVSATPEFSGPTGKIVLEWSAGSAPAGTVAYYEVGKREKTPGTTGWSAWTGNTTTGRRYEYSNLGDEKQYEFRVRAVDSAGAVSSWLTSSVVTVGDYTSPSMPETVMVEPAGWSNAQSVTLRWSGIEDNNLNKVQYRIGSGTWTDLSRTQISGSLSAGGSVLNIGQVTDGEHTVSVRGIDAAGNEGSARSANIKKDTQAPEVEIGIAGSVTAGRVEITGEISNGAGGSEFAGWQLEYRPDAGMDDWIGLIGGLREGSGDIYVWEMTGLEYGTYYVRLRAWDEAGNEAETGEIAVNYYGGSEQVAAGMLLQRQPVTSNIWYMRYISNQGTLTDTMLVANGREHVQRVFAKNTLGFQSDRYEGRWLYPEGEPVFVYARGRTSAGEEVYSEDTYELGYAKLEFSGEGAYNQLEEKEGVRRDSDRVKVAVGATTGRFTTPTTETYGELLHVDLIVEDAGSATVVYEISADGGVNWSGIEPVSRDGGATRTVSNRKYLTGECAGNKLKLRATLNGSEAWISSIDMEVRYASGGTARVIDNGFERNARGFTELAGTEHDLGNGQIVLKEGEISGSVKSTKRQVPGEVTAAVLEVEEEKPLGTNIRYYISTDGGASYEELEPRGEGEAAQWRELANAGTEVVIKAELSGSGGETPKLKGWKLNVKTRSGGTSYEVKLVEEPKNVSALANANYRIMVRWEPSETEGVTYNIYRSETAYFEAGEGTLAAEGIEGCVWSDYNLNYGKTYYYQVTAVKEINGHIRESEGSHQAYARMVDEGELEKRLGVEDYWSYASYSTQSGNGYVNMSNGNMVYTETDIMVPDPFFAMVMRRTYNSEATSKTGLGYGWDYSFNTTLMREYDEYNEEKGMVLKDGDGSLHRFELKADGSYAKSKGTFMELRYDEATEEYTIQRRDNVKYHFEAESMRLKKFSEPNGKELTLEYDARGNVIGIENTVGERLEISYKTYRQTYNEEQGKYEYRAATVTDQDYIYVNDHVDMIESVMWEESGESGAARLKFEYEYDIEEDQLTDAVYYTNNSVGLGMSEAYRERYEYNEGEKIAKIMNPEGKEYLFEYETGEVKGRLSGIEDPIGERYEFAYDMEVSGSANRKSKVESEGGKRTEYQYDGEGIVKRIIDGLGNAVNYTHNEEYQVTGTSYLNEINGEVETVNHVYGYDAKGNVTVIAGPEGYMEIYSEYNEYNQPGKVKVQVKAGVYAETSYEYDGNGKVIKMRDAEGRETRYAYEEGTKYLTSETDAYGKQVRYTYDEKGRVTEISEWVNGEKRRTAAAYEYDGYGRTESVRDGNGNETRYEYDRYGNVVKTRGADGSESSGSYSELGRLETSTDGEGNTYRYEYDAIGRIKKVTAPDGSETGIEYGKWDSDGNGTRESDVYTARDGEGRVTKEYYDKGGRLVKRERHGGSGEAALVESYGYDLIGNMTVVRDAAGRETQAEYDRLNRQIKTIYDPSGENITGTVEYDITGNVVKETDGEGNSVEYEYDLIGRLKSVEQEVSGETLRTEYTYDEETEGGIRNSTKYANGTRSEAIFDELGRKTEEKSRGADGTVLMRAAYGYDGNGNVTEVERNDGSMEKHSYDAMNRVSRSDYYEAGADGTGGSGYNVRNEYDGNGNVRRTTVEKGGVEEITSYAYDEMNRIKQATQGEGGSGALPIYYKYNLSGQVTGVGYPKEDGDCVAAQGEGLQMMWYGYDGYGRISSVSYQKNGTLEAFESGIGYGKVTVREYLYTSGGELEKTVDYNRFDIDGSLVKNGARTVTEYVYDSAGRTVQTSYYNYAKGSAVGTLKEKHTITYDKNSGITGETIEDRYGSGLKTTEKRYVYDEAGRLTRAETDGEATEYTYDKVGNRLTQRKAGETLRYTYNGLNQLTKITKDGKQQAEYRYDGRGNQVYENRIYGEAVINGVTTPVYQTREYEFDLRNLLERAEVSTPSAVVGNVVEYEEVVTENRYDGSGQRIRREENGRETRFYYMGSGLLYTTAGDGTLVTENILGLNGGIIGSKRFSDPYGTPEEEYANRYYFYHYDIRGSVTNIVGDDGKLVKGYEYDEYGNTTDGGEESFINEVTFTGSVRDLGSGLQYMNARYYDPATGRFVSQDTYTGTPYAPWTQHLYSYCGNNPVNMVDPTGHMPIKPIAVNDGGSTRVVPEPEPTPTPKPQEERSRPGRIPAMILLKLPEPHMLPEEAKIDILAFMGNMPTMGIPNSSIYTNNGLTVRFFGPDGRVKLDIDLTDHKNSKTHPNVPHKHEWEWDENGVPHHKDDSPLSEEDYDLLNEEDKKKLEKYNETLCWLAVPFGVAAANYCSSALMNKSSLNVVSSTGASGMAFFFNGCGSDYFAYGIR